MMLIKNDADGITSNVDSDQPTAVRSGYTLWSAISVPNLNKIMFLDNLFTQQDKMDA